MELKRVIDKESQLFLRDDFYFDKETETALDVEPEQGLYIPRWNGESWEEGATQEYINSLKTQTEPEEPSLEERIQALEAMELERILGGGF